MNTTWTGIPLERVSFVQQAVRCGARGCPRCPHGPYWYAYWREGKLSRSAYVGKTLPEPARLSWEAKQRKRVSKGAP